MMLSY
jgi:hypothetical protein